jgi:hypothetical protein
MEDKLLLYKTEDDNLPVKIKTIKGDLNIKYTVPYYGMLFTINSGNDSKFILPLKYVSASATKHNLEID